jgi:hypothetical protein
MQRARHAREQGIVRPLVEALPDIEARIDEATKASDHAGKPVIFVGAPPPPPTRTPSWLDWPAPPSRETQRA